MQIVLARPLTSDFKLIFFILIYYESCLFPFLLFFYIPWVPATE